MRPLGSQSVYGKNCAAASSSRLATLAGIRAMEQGGTAADACVAMAAVLNVVEPTSTGIGGDAFCLFWDEREQRVSAVNGSGRSPVALSLEGLARAGIAVRADRIADPCHAVNVTVPGAAAAWCDVLERHGRLGLAAALAPAIALAEEGFAVGEVTAHQWQKAEPLLRATGAAGLLLPDGRAPAAGAVFRNPALAQTLRTVSAGGKRAFYEGEIAEALVASLRRHGGVLELVDLRQHVSTFEPPVSTTLRGAWRVYECAPNGQGLAALLALNIVECFEWEALPTAQQWHVAVEAVRLAFADVTYHVADPAHPSAAAAVAPAALLDKRYARTRAALIDPAAAAGSFGRGDGMHSSDTVYLCAADREGNCCSFINSNYMGFGTGIECQGHGFTLQNRGNNFYCGPDERHPNRLQPGKRPYHTIIPGLVTRLAPGGREALHCAFGVMGGFMQPQGHLQVLLRMLLQVCPRPRPPLLFSPLLLLVQGAAPQEALDAGRFCVAWETGRELLHLEEGVDPEVMAELRRLGHAVVETRGWDRLLFGKGQVIERLTNGTYRAGSDVRSDGCALGS